MEGRRVNRSSAQRGGPHKTWDIGRVAFVSLVYQRKKKTINEKERKMYFIKEKRKVKLITRAFFKTTTYLIVKIK